VRREAGEQHERNMREGAQLLREFTIFFAVNFFTCVVGIIELLPEFEKIIGFYSWRFIAISALYFGLLLGIVFSVNKCFWLYEQNRALVGRFGFFFNEIEPFQTRGRTMKKILMMAFLIVFCLLYLVKIGLLE